MNFTEIDRQRSFQFLKKFLHAAFAVCIYLPTAHGLENKSIESTLNWLGDYGQALKTAVDRQRPVWLQFTGPWCPNCHRMDKESFKNPKIIEHLSKLFVPAKISCENDAELALSFGFTQLPATVLISPDGKILAKHEGFADAETLARISSQAGVVMNEKEFKPAQDSSEKALLAAKPTDKATDAHEKAHQTADALAEAKPESSKDKPEAAPAAEAALRLDGTLVAENKTAPDRPLEPLGAKCPVTLLDDKLEMLTDKRITASYAGQRYYFASNEARTRFSQNPERYIPARGGECVVSYVQDRREQAGSAEFPVIFDDRIFLCASEKDRGSFMQNPAQFADKDVRLAGLCPHCMAAKNSENRGSNLFQIRFGGSRYLFPDRAHMEAFLKSPLKYLR
ncbi:MAG: thioredoxin fold domain-containing protein [bacterium]